MSTQFIWKIPEHLNDEGRIHFRAAGLDSISFSDGTDF